MVTIGRGFVKMREKWVAAALAVAFFVAGFLILFDQYVNFGVWFQIKDIHHETLAFTAFALGIGVVIGSVVTAENAK